MCWLKLLMLVRHVILAGVDWCSYSVKHKHKLIKWFHRHYLQRPGGPPMFKGTSACILSSFESLEICSHNKDHFSLSAPCRAKAQTGLHHSVICLVLCVYISVAIRVYLHFFYVTWLLARPQPSVSCLWCHTGKCFGALLCLWAVVQALTTTRGMCMQWVVADKWVGKEGLIWSKW